jgi:alpha-D-ribose 1-methylphosphonate 5-phosphate C-P lyase
VPPYTRVKSLDFDDHPFAIQQWEEDCALCGAEETFLDEVILDDKGGKMYVCSDSHYCARRRAEGHRGKLSEATAKAYAAAVGADGGEA